MSFLPKNSHGCPYLLLAPMEGLGDRPFRRAMVSIGGFDEACTEFLRVPLKAHIPSLIRNYVYNETHPIPQAIQLMGSEPELMAEVAIEVVKLGAPRVDLNCGCPSNTVTGRGAGSSLLRDPSHLYTVAKALVDAVDVPVTAKLRAGFLDTSLFKENILAAQESGIKFLTLHPRTKAEGYTPPANWDLIAEAKSLLHIPLVGNGDILNVNDALRMLAHTKCDGLMIGRGSVINPFIFQEIKAHFAGQKVDRSWEKIRHFIGVFLADFNPLTPVKTKVNKLKQLLGFIFKSNLSLQEKRQTMLTGSYDNADAFLEKVLPLLKEGWN